MNRQLAHIGCRRKDAGFRDHGDLAAEAWRAKPGNPVRGDRYVVVGSSTTKERQQTHIHQA
jgi:hypothetical protein